jgi:uncharacterized membrane protein (DUF106 family)
MVADIYLLMAGAGAISFLSTLIQKKLMDIDLVRSLKGDMKRISQEVKKHKDDAQKVTELTKKQLDVSKQLMIHQMKPSMISSLPVLPAFLLFQRLFEGVVLLLPVSLPLIGAQLGWLGVFILTMIVSSLVFRKALGMDLT